MKITLKSWQILFAIQVGFALFAMDALHAEDAKPASKDDATKDKAEKITYQDHVLPIFRMKCGACHSADQAKGGLVVDSYTGLMQGGGSGEVVVGGDLDGSHLWNLINHTDEPKMPPKEPKLPDDMLAVIRKWIEAGAPETSDSKVKIKKPAFTLGTAVITTGKPEGPPPMPEGLSTEPLVLSSRGNAVTALATSPWAPLLAVSGHHQVLLYHTKDLRLVGVLPFPEGQPHVLKFSRNGSLLLAGGGRGGQSGRVVVWDVRTGARAFEVGAEYDAVLAADISSDHSQIALGGPRKVVRVYSTSDGELMYEIKKHTDWITALEFSPDGVLLATGDRSNGLFVWEAYTGREFYALNGHGAMISSVSWRSDSNILASASEDANIKLWEMTNGNMVKNWGAHGGGAAAVQFARDGRLLSTGRDKVSKLWDQNGAQQRAFPALADLGLEVAYCSETERAFAGDWSGAIRVWDGKEGTELPSLQTNPPTIAERLKTASEKLAALDQAAAQAAAQVAALQKKAADLKAAAEAATKTAGDTAAAVTTAQATQTATAKTATDAAAAVTAGEAALTAAKTALEAAVAAKTAAEKAVTDAAEADKAAAEKALADQVAAVQTAEANLKSAQTNLEKLVANKAAADKAAADAVAAVKVAVDAAAAAKTAAEKAVAAATPTPESTKQLADAEAAAAAAKAAASDALALVELLKSEQKRSTETASAQQ